MDQILNKIITYVKEHTQFSAPQVQSELRLGYHELMEALKTLQDRGAIIFIGGMCYEYNTEQNNDERPSESRGEDEDGFVANDMTYFERRRAYYEMRRQELIKRMQEETDDDEEDDEESNKNDEKDKEEKRTAEFREGVGNLCEVLKKVAEEKRNETKISDEFLDEIKNSVAGNLFEVYRSLCYAHICAKGLTFSNGARAEFFIHHYGKITELCDGGVTKKWMRRKPGYGYKRTKNVLEKVTDGLMLRMDDLEQLYVNVSDLSKLPAMYYYFYWLIESLLA